MASMTPERWDWINDYIHQLFGDPDDHLAGLMARAEAAGLPQIAVSPDVGRLLGILAASTPGRLAIELGTLAGYSGIWIARGLAPDGRLITVEMDPKHADFAEAEFATAGVADRVEVRRGRARDVLAQLVSELEPESVDFVFIDAHKPEYPDYFRAVKPLMASGGILVADNVLGTSSGWIDEGHGTDPFNRLVAADPDFLATMMPMRQGLLIARKR
ncbi:MAG: O-methyltransferase [Actinomycetes bacterium]|jgi:caffeoyl-CoA O-methyltransferase|nr:MAG: methyltransferase [Actinomycetota bacterium]